MICQYRPCQDEAVEEPTIIQIKGSTEVKQIHFCQWHQDQFEIYLPKWQQLQILRHRLKEDNVIPLVPPMPIDYSRVVGMKTTETINLATGKVVEANHSMIMDDDDDIPF